MNGGGRRVIEHVTEEVLIRGGGGGGVKNMKIKGHIGNRGLNKTLMSLRVVRMW